MVIWGLSKFKLCSYTKPILEYFSYVCRVKTGMILQLEMLQDEIQILKAVTEGDEKAFKKLFLYYYPKVVAFIREIVKDTKAAEDTAQDIFAKIWLIRLSLSGIHNFGSYLYVVSRNAALHYLKKSCPSVRIDEIDFIVDSAIDEKIQAMKKNLQSGKPYLKCQTEDGKFLSKAVGKASPTRKLPGRWG